MSLYERLSQGPVAKSEAPFLIQARVRIAHDENDRQVIDDWFYTQWLPQHPKQQGRSYSFLDREVRYIATRTRSLLLEEAETLGIKNGLTTYQLGPAKNSGGGFSFCHELGLLAELSSIGTEVLRRMSFRSGLPLPDGDATVEWSAIKKSHKSALRLLLAGSSVDYPVQKYLDEKVIIGNFMDHREKIAPDGIHGVLELKPIYVYRPNQLQQYCHATLNVPLYSTFGSWCQRGRHEHPRQRPGEWDMLNDIEKLTTRSDLGRPTTDAETSLPVEGRTYYRSHVRSSQRLSAWPRKSLEGRGADHPYASIWSVSCARAITR